MTEAGGQEQGEGNHRHVPQSQWVLYVCWQAPVTCQNESARGWGLTIVLLGIISFDLDHKDLSFL